MIWSFGDYSASTLDPNSTSNMEYHGPTQHSTTWQLTVNDDGSVLTSGDNGITVPSPSGTNLVLNMTNGSTLYMGYDTVSMQVKYYAHVLQSTWLGIGYGTSMSETNMVSW